MRRLLRIALIVLATFFTFWAGDAMANVDHENVHAVIMIMVVAIEFTILSHVV